MAFQEIRDRSTRKDNLLVHHDPKVKLILSVNASPVGLVAVISHESETEDRPIDFASRTLTTAEKNYAQNDREALANYVLCTAVSPSMIEMLL